MLGRAIVCSTPRGIIVSGTERALPTSWPRLICSTPRGIIVSGTCGRGRAAGSVARCSTPRGIIVSGTRTATASPARHSVCSTPRGVIVSGTSATAPVAASTAATAQRLAASSSAAPTVGTANSGQWQLLNASRHHRQRHPCGPGDRADQRRLCSTPRGIIVSGTRRAIGSAATAARCSTPRGIIVSGTPGTGSSTRRRSHLLNASRHHRQRHPWRRLRPSAARRSAQRLAASSSAAHRSRSGRHSHWHRLLNASRHHRQRHRITGRTTAGSGICSTPRGIIVSGTMGGRSPLWFS